MGSSRSQQWSLSRYDAGDFAFLSEHVTVERVRAHFVDFGRGKETRYELPGLGTLNFVMEGALGAGGYTLSGVRHAREVTVYVAAGNGVA